MRKLALIIGAWMALFIGLALILNMGQGSKKADSTKTTTTKKIDSSTIPLSKQKQLQVTPEIAAAEPSASGGQGTSSLPGASDDQMRIQLATSGWPAVAKLPYREKSISVDLVGVRGGQAVLNVKYQGSQVQAKDAVRSFLTHNYDYISHYYLRLISRADDVRQNKTADVVKLGMDGYRAVPYLPIGIGKTTLLFVGAQGKRIILEARYSGKKAQAVKNVAAILRMLKDRPSHYTIRYKAR